MTFDASKARTMFEEWYELCLENGIGPEEIVEEMGEMKLLINQDQIEMYDKGELFCS